MPATIWLCYLPLAVNDATQTREGRAVHAVAGERATLRSLGGTACSGFRATINRVRY